MWNIFGKFSYVWMAEGLIYHMTPKNLKIVHARVSTSHGMKIRLRKIWLSNLADREVPQHRNCWWSDEFMINYDGYGFVLCMMCPTSCPSPTLSHNMYCHLTTNTQQHHYHYHTTPHHTREVMLTTLPQSRQNVSLSIAPALKTAVSGWGVDSDTFYQTEIFCGKIITIMG